MTGRGAVEPHGIGAGDVDAERRWRCLGPGVEPVTLGLTGTGLLALGNGVTASLPGEDDGVAHIRGRAVWRERERARGRGDVD